MYILKNSFISIFRNKGRNILIGIIILVISASCTVTLAIRNTANNLVTEYENSHDLIATISFNRNNLTQNFKGGEDAQKSNIEAFNNIETFDIDDIKNYGDSEYLKGYYYTYTTSLDSDTLSKATDTFEYEVEDVQTSKSTSTSTSTTQPEMNFPMGTGNMGQFGEKHTVTTNNTTTVITKSMEKFGSSRSLSGDFEIIGYSSYDAMTEFIDGTYTISSGEVFSDFNGYECIISSELATLNELNVGSIITLKNSNTEATYDFTVTGIYTDNSSTNDTMNMYSNTANTIMVGSGIVEVLKATDDTLVTNVTPSFVLKGTEYIELFSEQLTSKGLNEFYAVNTNLDTIESATESIKNVETFATTFLLITLAISAVVLFVINMINIRERKYEIGVFRTIGISKFKLSLQFILELLIVTVIMLFAGAIVGSILSQPIGNMLLESEIESSQSEQTEMFNNFGKFDMQMNFKTNNVSVNQIDSIEAIVDIYVVLELLGIGMALTFISSLASMISIQRFSPLTILKERS